MANGWGIAVIDYEDHSRGGHFGSYLQWCTREFSTRFDAVSLFTPDPVHTAELLQPSGNVSCHPLPPGPRKAFYRLKRTRPPLAQVLRAAAKLDPTRQWCGFVMWGYDLRMQNVGAGVSGHRWATLGGNSYAARGFDNSPARREREVVDLCEANPDCAALLLLDHYVIGPEMKKAIWLPGYENTELPDAEWGYEEIPVVRAMARHADGHFSIGAFGILTGPRCIHEMLRLAGAHPEIRFALVGRIAEETVAEELRPLLHDQCPENLLVLPQFLKSEVELNAAVNSVDAVLLDGSQYPVHSGIVTRALAFGKFILTPESNSWTRDMILEYGTGRAYADSGEDFTAAWQAWRLDAGPDRSRAAAQAMMGPAAITACFDYLAERLKGVA